MMTALAEQVALVTGASRGVGRGVALGLAHWDRPAWRWDADMGQELTPLELWMDCADRGAHTSRRAPGRRPGASSARDHHA